MMCKELVPLIVLFMGLYGVWFNRKKILELSITNPKGLLRDPSIVSSLLTIAAGAAWYIEAERIIASFYTYTTQTYNPFSNWFYLGGSLEGIIYTAITNPFYVLQIAVTPFWSKVTYFFLLLGPLAFLSLLNLPILLISLPWFAPSMLSFLPAHYTAIGFQYPAFLIPFIFVSAVYGVKTITPAVRTSALQAFSKNPVTNRIMKNERVRKKIFRVANKPLPVVLILLLALGVYCTWDYSPLYAAPQVTFHDQALQLVIYTIPPWSSVATQDDIFPHLSHDLLAYPVYHPELSYDYILVDNTSVYYYLTPSALYGASIPPPAYSSVVPSLIENGTYGVVISINGIMLLKNGYHGSPLVNL
jgi:uncharacterized membrane protein